MRILITKQFTMPLEAKYCQSIGLYDGDVLHIPDDAFKIMEPNPKREYIVKNGQWEKLEKDPPLDWDAINANMKRIEEEKKSEASTFKCHRCGLIYEMIKQQDGTWLCVNCQFANVDPKPITTGESK